MEDFNLMVLGGGSAGFAAAIRAAELGFQVGIVEQGTIGGTCVNIGCVPSKTLIKAAEVCYRASYSNFKGMTACPPPSEWGMVLKQKDELVAALREAKYVNVLRAHSNISLIRGRAELTGGRGVRVGEKCYTADKIVIATGSHSSAPQIPGLKEAGFIDSEAALSLPILPKSMIVLGAGSIGLELGQLFARFGVQVTLLEGAERIAPAEEPEISRMLAQYLQDERLTVYAGIKIAGVDKSGPEYKVHVEVNGRTQVLTAEQLLVSTGRRANTEGLGLNKAGVELGPNGEIRINQLLQTTNPGIYAAGDCAGDPMFVYVAAHAGGLAAENALTGRREIFDLSALPRVTFTDPQIASVGLTEAAATAAGLQFETSILPLEHVPRAQAARNLKGLFKLIRERGTARLIGAHVLAAEAGEVIQEATLAIRFKLTTNDLVATYHPYLTMVEGIKLAALGFSKDVTELSCCAA
jgi:mercuric reductase